MSKNLLSVIDGKINISNDAYGKTNTLTPFICRADKQIVCALTGITKFKPTLKLTDISEIDFSVSKYITNSATQEQELNPAYKYLNSFYGILIPELGQYGYFRINEEPTIKAENTKKESRSFTAYSGESILQYENIVGFYVNQGTVSSLEMYDENKNDSGLPVRQIQLYNATESRLSLLDLVLSDDYYGWSIGHVDGTIMSKYRAFSIDNSQNVYSFLVNDVAQAFRCIFDFDTIHNVINVYDLETYGRNTNIYLSFERFIQEINVKQNNDEIYTVFNVAGGNDLDISYVNFGSNKIVNIDYPLSMLDADIYFVYKKYESYRDALRPKYKDLMIEYGDNQNKLNSLLDRQPQDSINNNWSSEVYYTIDDLETDLGMYKAVVETIESLYTDEDGNLNEDELKNSADAAVYYSYKLVTIPDIENELKYRNGTISKREEKVDSDLIWDMYGLNDLELKLEDFRNKRSALKEAGYNRPWSSTSDASKTISEATWTEHYNEYQQYAVYINELKALIKQRKKLVGEVNKEIESNLNGLKQIANTASFEYYVNHFEEAIKTELLNAHLDDDNYTALTNFPSTNLSPFFSHDITDIYNSSTNPTGYWMETGSNTFVGFTGCECEFTQLEDGWLHVHMDNSSGSSTVINRCGAVAYNPYVKAGSVYTFLFECRNKTSSGVVGNATNVYITELVNSQFFSGNVSGRESRILESSEGLTSNSGIRVNQMPSNGDYAFIRIAKKSEPDPEIDSSSYIGNKTYMIRFAFGITAGVVCDYDIRISMYEGEYWGGYIPYVPYGLSSYPIIVKSLYKESDYKDENYLITDIDDVVSTVVESEELYQAAVKRLAIESRPQLRWSVDTDSLYATKDFESLRDSLQLGDYVNLVYDTQSIATRFDENIIAMESGELISMESDIHGRNLLLRTESERNIKQTSTSNYTSYYMVSECGKTFMYDRSNSFTLSAQYEVTGNSSTSAYIYAQFNSTQLYPISGRVEDYVIDSPSGVYRRTFKLSDVQVESDLRRIRFVIKNATTGSVLKVSKVKLEYGDTATEWTPAIETNENLLLNSSFTDNYDEWSANSNHSIVTEDGYKCGHISGVLDTTCNIIQNIYPRIQYDDYESEVYTLSADIKLVDYVAGTTNPFLSLYFSLQQYDDEDNLVGFSPTFLSGVEITGLNNNLSRNNNKGWQHVSLTVKFPKSPDRARVYVYSRDWSGDLYYRNLKLERGDVATDWTPAPEDYQAESVIASDSIEFIEKENNTFIVDNYRFRVSEIKFDALDFSDFSIDFTEILQSRVGRSDIETILDSFVSSRSNQIRINAANTSASVASEVARSLIKPYLQVANAAIENAQITNAQVQDLQAVNARIETLIADSIEATEAKIDNATIFDLKAGNISSDKSITIASRTGYGSIVLENATMKYLDANNNVRMAVGYDANSENYDIKIYSAADNQGNQTLLWDTSTGVQSGAIANDLVTTRMISDDAITSDKINWTGIADSVTQSGAPIFNSGQVTLNGESLTTQWSALQAEVADISITASNQVFLSNDDGASYSPNTITLTPNAKLISESRLLWYYRREGDASWTQITDVVSTGNNCYIDSHKQLIVSKNFSAFTSTVHSIVFKCAANNLSTGDEEYSDTMTIMKLSNGINGESSLSVVMSNEAQTIATDENNHPLSYFTFSTDVSVFLGTTQLTPVLPSATLSSGKFKIQSATCDDSGISVSYSQTAGVVTYSTTQSSTIANTGVITITLQIYGIDGTITKKINYSSSISGQNGSDGEDAVLLRIDSSRGTVFKNNAVSTVLSVIIYKGNNRIENSTQLATVFGANARLEWEWLRLDDDTYGVISASDSRISDNGFHFTLSPQDVDVKVTFRCNLIE